MKGLRLALWGSLGLIAWSYAGYPLAAAAAARVRRYAPQADDAFAPDVTLVIAAHDEEEGIVPRLENLLELDYDGALEIVVASDGSTDRTVALVTTLFAQRGVKVLDLPRMGKISAQDIAVRATESTVVAFGDADSHWDGDALRLLVRSLADPEVGYVCGRVALEGGGDGDNREGLYWAYEVWLRERESACGSLTAGSGAIYAVRRSAYQELGKEHSHDIGLPFRLRRRGLRSVYEPAAVARERALATTEAEGRRKARMLSRAWWEVLRGGLLDPRGQPSGYYGALVSHRLLRYASGPLHLVALVASMSLASRDRSARRLLVLQGGGLAFAVVGRWLGRRVPLSGPAWYYVVVNAASVVGLIRALAAAPDTLWDPVREKQ